MTGRGIETLAKVALFCWSFL